MSMVNHLLRTSACVGITLLVSTWPAGAAAADRQTDGARDAGTKADTPDHCDGRCDRCDGRCCVRRVCVAKQTEKQITKVCWSYKCEDFCIPGPSIYCGEQCRHDACGCWSHSVWKPTCAEVRSRRVPVKTVVNRTVPSFAWTVEERCQRCRVFCFGLGGTLPPPRAADGAEAADDEASADTPTAPTSSPSEGGVSADRDEAERPR